MPPAFFLYPSFCKSHAQASPFQKQQPYSHFSEGATEAGKVIAMLRETEQAELLIPRPIPARLGGEVWSQR